MIKACCFTNFKLSRAHVIHIYKVLQKTSFFILFEVFDGRYTQKPTFRGLIANFSRFLQIPVKTWSKVVKTWSKLVKSELNEQSMSSQTAYQQLI